MDLARLGTPCIVDAIRWYVIPRGECFKWIVWFRMLQAVRRHLFSRVIFGFPVYLIYRHYEFKYGIHVNPNIAIGGGLRVVHGGVNLNASEIGENLTVYPGVMVGKNRGAIPKIGRNVKIFTNAVCVGGIKVGDNAVIGALTYVDFDVHSGEKIVGNKKL